jgi:hypothetical protein
MLHDQAFSLVWCFRGAVRTFPRRSSDFLRRVRSLRYPVQGSLLGSFGAAQVDNPFATAIFGTRYHLLGRMKNLRQLGPVKSF